MKGILYGIGVGPGEPELLTIKAVEIIKKASTVFCPISKKNNKSIALSIIKPYINEKATIHPMLFPMINNQVELEQQWKANVGIIIDKLDQGKDSAFITIGDPLIYSTYSYILKILKEKKYKVETIPGITSFSAISSFLNLPLAEKDEKITIIPCSGSKSRIKKALTEDDTIILLKVSSCPNLIAEYLIEECLDKSFVLVSKWGHPEQKVSSDIEVLKKGEVPYLSTLIVKKTKGGIN